MNDGDDDTYIDSSNSGKKAKKPISRVSWSSDGWRLGIASGNQLWVASLSESVVGFGNSEEDMMLDELGIKDI